MYQLIKHILIKLIIFVKIAKNYLNKANIDNRNTYNSLDIVNIYSTCMGNKLIEPEETILGIMRDQLHEMRMLDIGVGCGRTSLYFMDQVREYIGIDYSEQMINVCKRRFSSKNRNIAFHLCDATSMPMFEDEYFDCILFSFNGIDSIPFEDRVKSLREIKRLGKAGGFFIFSTHNLNHILKKLTLKFASNPIKMIKQLRFLLLFKAFNQNTMNMEKSGYFIINDGAHFFRLKHLYIRPTEQIKQLAELGFNNIRTFSLSDGKEITQRGELQENTDPYLYYLCNFG